MTGGKLTRKQEQAVAALLAHTTIGAAAAAVGVAEKTLRNWLKHPVFVKEYRQARRQVLEAVVGRMQGVAGEALETLQWNLHCGNPGVEVRAANALLEHATQGLVVFDFEARLVEIEKIRKGQP